MTDETQDLKRHGLGRWLFGRGLTRLVDTTLALSRAGLLANADAAIAGMTGAAGDEARIEWEYATEIRRDHPMIAALGQALGLDDDAIDDLFRQAAQIL